MAQQEIMRAPRDVDKRRSSNIERAIQRVEDGTHGLSDSGGKLPSPRPSFERLHDSAKLHFEQKPYSPDTVVRHARELTSA
jgi:hypothetical protein